MGKKIILSPPDFPLGWGRGDSISLHRPVVHSLLELVTDGARVRE